MKNFFRITSPVIILTLSLGLSTYVSTSAFGQAATPANQPAAAAPAKPASTAPAKPVANTPLPYTFQDVEKGDEMDKIRTQIPNIIKRGSFESPEEKERFLEFYQMFFFARWINNGQSYQVEVTRRDSISTPAAKPTGRKSGTKVTEEPVDNWSYPMFIEEFRSTLNRCQGDGEPQQELVKLAYKFATDVIESNQANCTSAAKFNCMLLLGNMFYKVEPQSSAIPKPYAPAVKYLVSSATNAKLPCYLRIGALEGLAIMLDKAKLDDAQKKAVYEALYPIMSTDVDVAKFADSKEDPTGAGAIWLRERAIIAMGFLAGPNQNEGTTGYYPPKDVIKSLYIIIKNKELPLTTRMVAVESLGSYNFSKYPELKAKLPPHLLNVVAEFIVDGIQAEIDRQCDPLVWGEDTNEFGSRSAKEDSATPHDDTSDAIFLIQRALPYIFAAKTAMNGVNPGKGWDGLMGFGSETDKANVKKVIQAVRNVNNLGKSLKASSTGDESADSEEEAAAPSKVQDVIAALTEIQSIFQKAAK